MSARDAPERHRLAALLEALPDATLAVAADGTLTAYNREAARLYGRPARCAPGAPLADLVVAHAHADRDAVRDAWHRALRDGTEARLCTHLLRSDAPDLPIEVLVRPVGEGTAGAGVAAIVVVRDRTAELAAGARLDEARSRFAGAFHAAASGMALVSPDGRILEANAALCALLHRDAEELRSSTVADVTHPDDLDADLEQMRATIAGDIDYYRISKRYVLPDGGLVWGELTVTLVRDAAGEPLHFVSQVQDGSGTKTVEGQLRRYAEQLEALSRNDPTTGLPDRPAFEAAVAEELGVHAAGGPPCSVIVADAGPDVSGVAAVAAVLATSSRTDDVLGHVGTTEVAILLRGVGPEDLRPIAERTRVALGRRARCGQASSRPHDGPEDLLRRALQDAGTPRRHPHVPPPAGVDQLLELARHQLGMPISFLARHDGPDEVFVRFSGDHSAFGVSDGDALPLADTHCQRMLDGRIGNVVGDLAEHPETRELAVTTGTGLRAYAGVAVTLSSGQHYGTLCAVDPAPRLDLGAREIELLTFVGRLVADLIDHEAARLARERAQAGATGVRTLLGALEVRDHYTGEHSREVVALASDVARRLGLQADEIRDIEQVALLHDLGKLGIPDAILHKQGPLTPQEWQLMRQHPIVGERIVAGTVGLAHLAPAMRAEHERWDGGGYPDGLAGEAIPLASRITLACDALHAMTSDRPYRPALTDARARAELRACAGTQFDPRVVEALLESVERPSPLPAP